MKPNPVVFGAALLALYLYTKKSRAATPEEPTGPGPEPTPEEPPKPNPTEPLPPKPNEPPNDGEHPRKEPRQGYFYQVVPGDTLSKIVVRAGLPAKAHFVATKHPQNDWIRRITLTDDSGKNYTTLKLWPRYEPAYKGEYLQRSTGSLPVVYVPTLEEYEALK